MKSDDIDCNNTYLWYNKVCKSIKDPDTPLDEYRCLEFDHDVEYGDTRASIKLMSDEKLELMLNTYVKTFIGL